MQLEALAVGINLEICVDLVEVSGIAVDKLTFPILLYSGRSCV